MLPSTFYLGRRKVTHQPDPAVHQRAHRFVTSVIPHGVVESRREIELLFADRPVHSLQQQISELRYALRYMTGFFTHKAPPIFCQGIIVALGSILKEPVEFSENIFLREYFRALADHTGMCLNGCSKLSSAVAVARKYGCYD